MIKGMFGINHTPCHRRCAGAVFFNELHPMRAWFGIKDVIDIALTPDGDVFGLVLGHRAIAHAGKQGFEFFGILMGEFDKFEPVGSGRVIITDGGTGASCGNGPIGSLL